LVHWFTVSNNYFY